MNSNEDIIEILDDISEETPSFNMQGQNTTMTQNINSQNNTLGQQQIVPNEPINIVEEVNYDPIESQKQEIKIETEEETDNSKSGLSFVIVLFIILAAFIIALPYISKLIP